MRRAEEADRPSHAILRHRSQHVRQQRMPVPHPEVDRDLDALGVESGLQPVDLPARDRGQRRHAAEELVVPGNGLHSFRRDRRPWRTLARNGRISAGPSGPPKAITSTASNGRPVTRRHSKPQANHVAPARADLRSDPGDHRVPVTLKQRNPRTTNEPGGACQEDTHIEVLPKSIGRRTPMDVAYIVGASPAHVGARPAVVFSGIRGRPVRSGQAAASPLASGPA